MTAAVEERAPVSINALSDMLDADIARSGAMESFMIRAGLLREVLDELARHRLDREALEKLRLLSERATWGPWCWEQCGDKHDDPIVGIAMPADDADGARAYAGRLTDEDAYRYGRIAGEWQDCDGHSASANADFAVAAVNFVRAMLSALPTQETNNG